VRFDVSMHADPAVNVKASQRNVPRARARDRNHAPSEAPVSYITCPSPYIGVGRRLIASPGPWQLMLT